MNAIDELKARFLFNNCTNENAIKQYLKESKKLTVYAGFDATAKSLHIGNLTALMMLRIFQRHGHKVIALIGGATTKIGDPSGKDSMRKMLSDEEIVQNKNYIKQSILTFLPSATIVDNNDWFEDIGYIDILRDIGSIFSINKMLTMDSVKMRLDRQQNLSFLEFNYIILQSYDFWHLYKNYGCNVQIGGSDQWGNIVFGVDLIGKKELQSQVFGITSPLITRSDGKKMGKSETGAIWLNSEMLSDFDYFQYFRNITDQDVKKMLLIFTDIATEEVEKICNQSQNINDLKIVLAFEATKICRGIEAAENAKNQAENIFVKNVLDAENAIKITGDISILDLLVNLKATPSKGEARKLIANNGVKIDNITIIESAMIINGKPERYFKISVGKKKHFTIFIN